MAKMKKPYLSVKELQELFGGATESHYGKRCIITHRLDGGLDITVTAGPVSGGKGSMTVQQVFHVTIVGEEN